MKNVLRILLFILFPVGMAAVEVTPTVQPTYPESARTAKAKMQGDVTLEIKFNDYGSAISVSRQSQFELLETQAKNVVWKWHFSGTTSGQTVRVVFHYRLDNSVKKTTVKFTKGNREVTITAPPLNP